MAQSDNTDRPALFGDDAIGEIRALFEQRDGLYRDIATSVVHIDGVGEESVLRALIALEEAGV